MPAQRVGTHEAPRGRRIVPSTEIVEAGFGVALFAGEFVGGGGVASELFAEGKEIESVNRSRGIGHAGDEARRTQMVFVHELGGGVLVLGEELAREGDVIGGEIAGSVGLVNDLAGHVVDILGDDGTDGLLYSATFGVVGVTGGSGRAVPECAIHLNGAILGVIEIDVVAVVSHVAGGVIPGMIVLERWLPGESLGMRIHGSKVE